jgi:2,5-diamino-6-(ribosylamino)-4(3H)-pyrimidinone 5'-phosphate reductase
MIKGTIDRIMDSIPSTPPSYPCIILSWAQSINGVLGRKGERFLLSGPESLILTHRIRNCSDAILVGINTLLEDSPGLDVIQDDGSRKPGELIIAHY